MSDSGKPDDDTPEPGVPASGTPEPGRPRREREAPTKARITIWIVVAAIALYFIGTGLYGILTK